MNIIVFEPYMQQYSKEIEGTTDSMKLVVGGELEVISLNDSYLLVCNKDGISLRLRQNNHRDNMVGIFFVAKNIDGKIVGLEKLEARKFTSKRFVFNNNLI